jgi:hypothetical protein
MKIYKKRLLTQHAAFIYVYILNQNAVKRRNRENVCVRAAAGLFQQSHGI